MCNNKQPITIVRGTTNAFSLTIKDDDGNTYSLADGEVLRFGVKALPTDNAYLFEKTMTSEDTEDGGYVFTVAPDDTIDLSFGSYWYDIGLQNGASYFNIIPASPFNISYNVTEAAE